jgi:uncharacterized RDD family membrane protein YckC
MIDVPAPKLRNTPSMAEPTKPQAKQRDIITPEGVRLTVTIADYSTRMAAVLIDALFVVGAIIVVALLAIFADMRSSVVWSYVGFFAFLDHVLYFPWFELILNGRTPGKRSVGIRVIGRNGAPLNAAAVLARNLARELEMWLPLTFALLSGDCDPLVTLLTLAWVLCFAAIPLFSAERMRAGDVLAGTWVIVDPKPSLVRDLLVDSPAPAKAPPIAVPPVATTENDGATPKPLEVETPVPVELEPEPELAVVFTPTQLDAYGEAELNTLADLLYADGPGLDEKFQDVAEAVAGKIDHDRISGGEIIENKAFLEAYYRSARAKMETNAQWGRLRQNKFDRYRGRKTNSNQSENE